MEAFPGEWIEDRDEFVKKYTDSGDLKDTLKVQMFLEKNSAVLSHQQDCDIGIQEKSDSFFSRQSWNWNWDFDSGHRSTEGYQDHFKELDESGVQYCNPNLFLVCKREDLSSQTPPFKYACLCPSDMIWENGNCVFTEGSQCYLKQQKSKDGNYFIKFDVVDEKFGQGAIFVDCVGKTSCNNDERVCAPDSDLDFLVPPKDLAVFFKKHMDAGIDYDLSNTRHYLDSGRPGRTANINRF